MKKLGLSAVAGFLFMINTSGFAQQKTENIIIITTDGFRWQEIFGGMDSSIAVNSDYNQGDSDYILKKYWANNIEERRIKLLPFLWSTIASKGQIYGNMADGAGRDSKAHRCPPAGSGRQMDGDPRRSVP